MKTFTEFLNEAVKRPKFNVHDMNPNQSTFSRPEEFMVVLKHMQGTIFTNSKSNPAYSPQEGINVKPYYLNQGKASGKYEVAMQTDLKTGRDFQKNHLDVLDKWLKEPKHNLVSTKVTKYDTETNYIYQFDTWYVIFNAIKVDYEFPWDEGKPEMGRVSYTIARAYEGKARGFKSADEMTK